MHSVNDLVMPDFYRRLIGNVPPQDYLDFPENLPADWMSIRKDVIMPWLLDKSGSKPEKRTLSEELKTWTLQEKNK